MTPWPSTLAHWQAVSIWSDLEDARIGLIAGNGHRTEIYAYRLLPSSPYAETAHRDSGVGTSPHGAATLLRASIQARDALVGLARQFEERRGVTVLIDGLGLDEYARGVGFLNSVMVEVRCSRSAP